MCRVQRSMKSPVEFGTSWIQWWPVPMTDRAFFTAAFSYGIILSQVHTHTYIHTGIYNHVYTYPQKVGVLSCTSVEVYRWYAMSSPHTQLMVDSATSAALSSGVSLWEVRSHDQSWSHVTINVLSQTAITCELNTLGYPGGGSILGTVRDIFSLQLNFLSYYLVQCGGLCMWPFGIFGLQNVMYTAL